MQDKNILMCYHYRMKLNKKYKNGFTLLNPAKREFRQRRNYLTGFTLIELLVVVSIIGVLLSIILISFSGTKKDARNARRETDIRQIRTAMEFYYNDNKAYLTSSDNLCKDDTIGEAMKLVPEDPLSNSTTQKCYTWVDNTDSACDGKFCVYAVLEDTGFFAASYKGIKLLDTAPVAGFCECW